MAWLDKEREVIMVTMGLGLRIYAFWRGLAWNMIGHKPLGRNRWRRQVMSFGKKVCPVCSKEVKYVFGEDGRVRPLCPKCDVYLDQGNLRPVMYGYESMDEVEY
jgi:hypothetical protein